jgi:hypothetical protein
LEKEGWTLLSSPFKLVLPPRLVYIDLRVTRGINGSREQIIVVEVKCFPDQKATTRDLYATIGQYLVYRAMIIEADYPYSLYLAVPEHIFNGIFDTPVKRVIGESRIKLVVINVETETVVQWIE